MRVAQALLAAAVAAAPVAHTKPNVAASGCFPCSFWQTWGQRSDVCADPSEGLLADALLCWCSGACAADCSIWCASYAACEASGDPSCVPSGATDACASCAYGQCAAETNACSGDLTGCATSCSTWLAGSPVCLVDTPEAVALSDCACFGACSGKCSGACGLGYLDTTGPVSQQCRQCLGKQAGCGGLEAACAAN